MIDSLVHRDPVNMIYELKEKPSGATSGTSWSHRLTCPQLIESLLERLHRVLAVALKGRDSPRALEVVARRDGLTRPRRRFRRIWYFFPRMDSTDRFTPTWSK